MPGTANSGGRNRKSASAHKLQGTYQKVRHAGVKTPEAPPGVPKPPKDLEGDALAEWRRMVDRLSAVGSLSAVDDAALYQYARLFAETEAIAVTQVETAATIALLEENLHGEDRQDLLAVCQEITKLKQLESRYTTQIRQGRMAIRQFLVEFGMTPSARTRVRLPEKPEQDPFDEFDGPVN